MAYQTYWFVLKYLCNEHFASARECVKAFERGWQSSEKFDNSRCWGSPCSWLGFDSTQSAGSRPDFEGRIEPMFEERIVELWREYFSDQV
ncbi:hypothetical protein K435DRAFT_875857 [Dendrothele bispora CBS 962.96]|uniref:Uncharacterized protein n=1 Tax=Dendrothele bispora (strain CBS 962.96) TaxID=1314807 RepID=A0A4S8KTK2_DENBC|nr:hypothetical protein K435DRAFT_875857 [Dendrothele bispora CBS 962.96]